MRKYISPFLVFLNVLSHLYCGFHSSSVLHHQKKNMHETQKLRHVEQHKSYPVLVHERYKIIYIPSCDFSNIDMIKAMLVVLVYIGSRKIVAF